jgi:hypothetical protein
MKMTPLLSGRRGGGGGWHRRRLATTPNPSLPRRGMIFITGGEPKDHEAFAQDDSAFSLIPNCLCRDQAVQTRSMELRLTASRTWR